MSVLDSNISVFRFFEEISKIPRGSFHEEKIADYLEKFAIERDLKYVRDDMNNIVIYKEASSLYHGHDPLLLQGHMDMVCEKDRDCQHDFENDPIDIYEDNGYLKARGTTLGADDGCGVAIMLALLDDKEAKHPPLECLFTVQEEVGLYGAMGIDPKLFKAKRMIGLDGGDEVETITSAAGGAFLDLKKDITYEDNQSPVYSLSIKGLTGGHSGADIDQERGNAITMLSKFLHMLIKENIDIRIVTIDGGLKSNAIPRECQCVFASENSINEIEMIITKGFKAIRDQYRKQEPHLSIELHVVTSDKAMNQDDSEAIVNTLFLCPNGLIAKSKDIEGLTLISLNCGIIKTLEDHIEITYTIRSPIKGAVTDLTDKIGMISSIYGMTMKIYGEFGGWPYDPNSKIRKALIKYFKNEYGIEIKENATHGGLETGVFKSKIPNLDIVTYGPNMTGIHTPNETLDLNSFKRVYCHLKEFIETL